MRPYRRIPADADGERPSLAERLRALRLVPHFLKLVWEAHPGYATAIVLLRIAQAFGPLALLWVGKLIIDAVVANIAAPSPDWAHLARLVGLELGIALVLVAMPPLSALLVSLLGDIFSNRLTGRSMQNADTTYGEAFEVPE